jgi:hypothetical protein
VGVVGVISFDSLDIFKYQNAIKGQFLSQKKLFFSTFCQFLPFFMKKNFDIKEIFDCAELSQH